MQAAQSSWGGRAIPQGPWKPVKDSPSSQRALPHGGLEDKDSSLTEQETRASLQTLTSSSSFPGPGCSLTHHHSQDSPLSLASTPL